MTILWLVYKGYYKQPFSHFDHRIIQEIYVIVSILNDMSISTAFFIYLIFYYLKITWKTHINHIFLQSCLLSSHFISKNVSAFYSAQLILLKLILNIKNAANVVLHTAVKTKVLVLFRSCCLIGKSLKRIEVSCLFYVIWLKTIHTLNYYYYSIYLKNVECLKNNYHNTGKTDLYWCSHPPNYTYQSCFYHHYHSKNE